MIHFDVKTLDILNCAIGTVSSREDGSVAFRVITPELRASEKGEVMAYHGRACRVVIAPHEGESDETVTVETEREVKTASQRMRGVLFLVWKKTTQPGDTDFNSYYERQMEMMIDKWKSKLED